MRCAKRLPPGDDNGYERGPYADRARLIPGGAGAASHYGGEVTVETGSSAGGYLPARQAHQFLLSSRYVSPPERGPFAGDVAFPPLKTDDHLCMAWYQTHNAARPRR